MKNCLVVDDSRVMRTVARRIFEELQFAIGEAEDGMGALDACREKMPDLIFLDWDLPSMPAVEFVKSLRGQQNGQRPVILFATTENDAGEIAHALAAGANDFILKPFDRASLRAKLAEIAA
ncbi:MAG TPA: response regulator [Rhizomicrobium sp.]|nr:response regulator [Rhizomicrobium sp.]